MSATTPDTTTATTRMNWAAPPLAHLLPRSPVVPVLLLVLAAAVTFVDVAVMYPAVARSMGHSPAMTWATAAGLGVLALITAGMAGYTWRGAVGNHPGSAAALVLPGVLLVGWAGLGVWIMWMRLTVSEVATTASYEGTATQVDNSGFDAVAAGMFLAVYLLCGTLTFGDLYHWRNDAYTEGRKVQESLVAAHRDSDRHEPTYQHLLGNHHKRQGEIDRLDEDAAIARHRNATFAAGLKQMVRDEMAVGFGDPAKTGITSARHPGNPAASDTIRR